MNRRKFITSTGAAGLLAANGLSSAAAPKVTLAKPVLMKVGDQTAPTNETHLKYLARYSVRNICGYPEIEGDRLYATVEELNRMVDLAGKCGISIDCTAPPFLESSHIDKEKHPAIMLAQSPERDRDIESLQTMIKNCAQAGIPSIKYNMSILGVVRHRTHARPGRCHVQHLETLRSPSQSAAHPGRARGCGYVLGTHHLLPRPRDSRCQ